MKKILAEVIFVDNNARWGSQISNDRKGIQFSDAEHLEQVSGSGKPRDSLNNSFLR